MTPISNNIDVEVRNRSEQSVDIIGGRLKQFASQWQCITSDPFILNSGAPGAPLARVRGAP